MARSYCVEHFALLLLILNDSMQLRHVCKLKPTAIDDFLKKDGEYIVLKLRNRRK